MTVSIKDIARIAGVSHSTVSRALTNSPLVNPETAERIRQLAEQMGYSPSVIARSLVTRRTRTLGLVVTRMADPFIAEVAHAIELTALDHGYSVLFSSAADSARELAAVRNLRERRVDGIIVQSSRLGDSYHPLLDELAVPVVLINNQRAGHYIYSVGCDNVGGARLAVNYLISRGHTRIGYVPGPPEAAATGERRRGWTDALTAAGLATPDLIANVGAGGGLPEGGLRGALDLLARADRPTALFCYNDASAIGALHGAHRRGLRVPDDLSIVGFDDIPLAAYTYPPLTTIAQPKAELGRRAVAMLLDLLDSADSGLLPDRARLLPGALVERESVAAPHLT